MGRPIDTPGAYVPGARGEPLPAGVVGELYLGGAGVARGDRGRPELPSARFRPDPVAGRPRARPYRTGDPASFPPRGGPLYPRRAHRPRQLRGFRPAPA